MPNLRPKKRKAPEENKADGENGENGDAQPLTAKKHCTDANDKAHNAYTPTDYPSPEEDEWNAQCPVDLPASPQSGAETLDIDPAIAYTTTGATRAHSEAKRSWNHVCTFEGCDRRFNRPCRLQEHIKTHTKEKPFVCHYLGCDKSYPRKEHLTRHIATVHEANGEEFVCDWQDCGKSFVTAARLRKHRHIHEKKKQLTCTGYPPCSMAFRNEEKLQEHVDRDHLKIGKYKCTYIDEETQEPCTKHYQRKESLTGHINREHRGHWFFCLECRGDDGQTLAFKTFEEHARHNREVHPPFCVPCNKPFSTPYTLQDHIDHFHDPPPGGNPTFPCVQCDKVFDKKSNLTTHVRTVHNKEKPFSCATFDQSKSNKTEVKAWDGTGRCDMKFTSKASTEQHIRTQHLGIKYSRRHLRVAKKKKVEPSMLTLLTGVGYEEHRPIACPFGECVYRFSSRGGLKHHLRSKLHGWTDDKIDEFIRDADITQEYEEDYEEGWEWDSEFEGVSRAAAPAPPLSFVSHTDSVPTPIDPALLGDSVGTGKFRTLVAGVPEMDPSFSNPVPLSFDDFHLSLAGDDAELDAEMGLAGLSAIDVHTGLDWNEVAA